MKDPKKNLLLIFTRNPELGKCKTRLATTIGDKAALEVYQYLLRHTSEITKTLSVEKKVYYSREIWHDDIWDASLFQKHVQQGDDLGERILNAFTDGFDEGFEKIIIIGSDMYNLSTKDLEKAFDQLDAHDFVIGPAEDGGYYLLGMKKFKPELFKKKAWGTETVLKDSLKNLKDEIYVLLDTRNDIDVYDDIKDIVAFAPFIKHISS